MGNFKKIDGTINLLLKLFVYKLEEDVELIHSKKFQRLYNKKTEEFDGKAYIKSRYTLKHNGVFYGGYKTMVDLLKGMLSLKAEIDPNHEESYERKLIEKAGESND